MLASAPTPAPHSLYLTEKSGKREPKKQLRTWTCLLTEELIGDYLIVPLCSIKQVITEADRMNNFCREYIARCAGGTYSLFSIRSRSGERFATLGLSREDDHWQVDRCAGPSDVDVLEESMSFLDEDDALHTESYATEIYYIAHEVARLMNAPAIH